MHERNPFNPNSVVSSSLFAGRVEQVHDICRKLTQLKHGMPASFFVYGERGIGKTALVKLIRSISRLKDEQLHNLNLLSSYYAVEADQDIGSVLQESINKLTDEMDGKLISDIGEKLGDIFKNGKFQIGAFGFSAGIETRHESESQREITIKDQTVSILSNIIRSMRDGSDERSGILIVIDEIHNLKNITGAASILRNIVTTLDVENLGQVSFLLVGYEEDMEKFFSLDTSAKRTFDLIKLDVMPDNEAVEVLEKGFDVIAVKYDEGVLRNNISVAGGYPHSIQIIGHYLVQSDSDNEIDQKDWDEAALTTAFSLRSKEFSNMYNFEKPLTISDKILVVLAQANKHLSKKELSKAVANSNIYQYIPQLKKSGAIKEDGEEKLFLQSQLFRTMILVDQFIREQGVKGQASNSTG